jgi:hypothetical protein
MEPLTEADPASIGGYELRARLGTGGFGQVFLGLSPGGRAVAVKVLQGEMAGNQDFLHRFRLEVVAAQRVNGIYTAPVVAAGLDDRPPWVATGFVPGPTLARMISEHGPLPELAVWRLLAGLVEALQAIHACGLVHRDLKPANVMLAGDGPRVIDFGISKAVGGTTVTSAGMVFGTPGYMAPEQVDGDGVGPASDVFALGCVLAYAASGNAPFGDGDAAAVLYRVVHGQPRLDTLAPPVRAVAERCLAKDAAARPGLAELAAIGRDGPDGAAGRSPTSFWPPRIARVIRDYEDQVHGDQADPESSAPPPAATLPPTGFPARAAAGAVAGNRGQPDRYGGYPGEARQDGGYPERRAASYPPGQAGWPTATEERPDPPLTVRGAMILMHAGAALSGVIAVLAGIGNGTILAAPDGGKASSGALYALYALAALGLWLGMAAGIRRRSRTARAAGPLLFILFTFYLMSAFFLTDDASLTAFALVAVSWLIGAGASVLLWVPPSGYFFRRRSRR